MTSVMCSLGLKTANVKCIVGMTAAMGPVCSGARYHKPSEIEFVDAISNMIQSHVWETTREMCGSNSMNARMNHTILGKRWQIYLHMGENTIKYIVVSCYDARGTSQTSL